MELLEITDREFDNYKKNLARNYRRYEKAFENRNKKIYTGDKLTKQQFFGKYLQAKQRGLKYSAGLLLNKPFLGDHELMAINRVLFSDMEFDEFKEMFYGLPVEEQKGLIHYYFKSGLANLDEFQYEGITCDSADPDVQSILDIIAKNRIRRGME